MKRVAIVATCLSATDPFAANTLTCHNDDDEQEWISGAQVGRLMSQSWTQVAPADECQVSTLTIPDRDVLHQVKSTDSLAMGAQQTPSGPCCLATTALGVSVLCDATSRFWSDDSTSHELGSVLLHGAAMCQAESDRLGRAIPLVMLMDAHPSHDVGQALIERVGGIDALIDCVRSTSLVLALIDDMPLGGLHGAGAQLVHRTSLSEAQAQELDRHACAQAHALQRAINPLIKLSPNAWGTGAGGGAALTLRACGARAYRAAEILNPPLCWNGEGEPDLVMTCADDMWDAASLPHLGLVDSWAQRYAAPLIVIARSCAIPRPERAQAGIHAVYTYDALNDPSLTIDQALTAMTERVARTWSRSS